MSRSGEEERRTHCNALCDCSSPGFFGSSASVNSEPISTVLRLQIIKAIVNSRRFKGSSSDEPRRVQVLDLYCLTRFESEGSGRGDVY